MNLFQRTLIVTMLTLLTSQLVMAEGYLTKDGKQLAYFISNDTLICDEGEANFFVYLDIDAQTPFLLTYNNGNVDLTQEGHTPNNHVFSFKLPVDLKRDPEGKHVRQVYTLKSLYSQQIGTVELSDEMIVDVWGTPEPGITNAAILCGDTTTLIANGKWEDVSTYKWSVDRSDAQLSDANSRFSYLVLPHDKDQYVTITLEESTGEGRCKSQTSQTTRFVENPSGYVKHLDDEGNETEVKICTSVEDPAFDFEAVLNLEGHEPFDVTMSNGQTFDQIPLGETTQMMHHDVGEAVYIEKIVDKMGCVSEYPSVNITGKIDIIDRLPVITAPTDTLVFTGRNVAISRELSEMGSDSFWKVRRDSIFDGTPKADNIISQEGKWYLTETRREFRFRTNKTGMLYVEYFEKNHEEGLVGCPSETVVQCVMTMDELNAPNGFSPNADFKNDYLVLEGIPDNNHIAIYDQKGKKIFEKTNYRNDWNAEGVEDGYYVYTFEGDGVKTVKETLVIKRSK